MGLFSFNNIFVFLLEYFYLNTNGIFMRFLNDKFFRTTVVVFLLLMILPFIFSTPRPEDNNDYALPSSETPFYQAIDKIARFYGLKKQDNKTDSSIEIRNTDNFRKMLNSRKEESKETKQEENSSEQKQESAVNIGGSSVGNTNTQGAGSNYPTANNNYSNSVGEDFYFSDEEKTAKPLTEKDKILYDENTNLTRNNRRTLMQEAGTNTNNYSNNKTTAIGTTPIKNNRTNTYTGVSINPEDKNYFFDNKKALKGTLGQNYFTSSNKKAQDIYQSFDNSVKDLNNFKLSQEEKKQNKNKEVSFITYRTHITNPKTGKKETLVQKETVTKESLIAAAELRKIAEDCMKDKNYDDINPEQCPTNAKSNCFIAGIAKMELEEFQGVVLPPHTVSSISDMIAKDSNNSTDDYNKNYDAAHQAALNSLPNKAENFPTIEIFYKDNKGNITRLDDDTFQVLAIQNVLADKVQIPANNSPINFENAQRKIYVVPDQNIYNEYTKREIPVILYPNFTPEKLFDVYKTATKAISTFNNNQKKLAEQEQDKIAQEIINKLKN